TLLCPSEPNGAPVVSIGTLWEGVTSYGNFHGDWYVWSNGGPMNRQAFSPNASKRLAPVTPGPSNTIVFGETQVLHYQLRTCSSLGGLTPTNFPDTSGADALIKTIAPSCSKRGNFSHQKWANGNTFSSGVTTATTPNSKVLIPDDPNPYDIV